MAAERGRAGADRFARLAGIALHALGRWLDLVQRFAGTVLIATAALTALALVYTARNLGVDTDTAGMIADDVPFMRDYQAFKGQFPELADNIVIVVEADTPDRARDAVDRLAAALAARPDQFPYLHVPGGGAFFAKNGLLYLDRDELLDLLDSLADSQPLLQRLRTDMTLRGLMAVLNLAADGALPGSERIDDLDWLFGRVAGVVEDILGGRLAQLSWQEIMEGREAEPKDKRGFVMVQPADLGYDSLLPGDRALSAVRRIATEAGLTAEHGVRVALTGGLALAHDELQTVVDGALRGTILSFVLVAALVVWGLKSLRQTVATLATLIVGLIWTAAFAAFAIGHLNLISVGFAILFFGLGIDHGIHLSLRVRDFALGGTAPRAAVRQGALAAAGALGLCVVATALGFYAFLPTSYAGVSELGVITGTGLFVSLLANFTVLPAIATLWPLRPPPTAPAAPAAPANRSAGSGPTVPLPMRRPGMVAIGAGLSALVALALLPRVAFDFNPLHLQDQGAESVQALRRMMADGTRGLWAAGVLARDAEGARALATRFERLAEVDFTVSLLDLVAADQDDKLELIGDIAAVMSTEDQFATPPPPPSAADQRAAARNLGQTLNRIASADGQAPANVARLGQALIRFDAAADSDPALIERMQQALVGALPARLEALARALGAERFGLDDLPRDLVQRLRGADGSYRVEIHPAEDIAADNDALRRFVAALRTVDAAVTDEPVVVLEAGRTVIGAFVQALVLAVVAIAVLLWALTRSLRDTAIVLAPLVLASMLTGATTTIAGIPFNFANVIVLPLLLGFGVDSPIHIVHRHRIEPDLSPLRNSTARAVVFSALTSIAGFGSLALSSHRGTASMGELLIVGLGFTMICTLLLVPALLAATRAKTRV